MGTKNSSLKANNVDDMTMLYFQSKKTITYLLIIFIIVMVTMYIFVIWNSAATIDMLQTAAPTDPFKENNSTFQLYKNLAIGSVSTATLSLLLLIFLSGAVFVYFKCIQRMYRNSSLAKNSLTAVVQSSSSSSGTATPLTIF